MKYHSIRNCAPSGLNGPAADLITRCVCDFSGYSRKQLQSGPRVQSLANARMIWKYLLHEMLSATVESVTRYTRGKEHSTTLHSIRRVREMIAVDKVIRGDVDAIRAMCQDALAKNLSPDKIKAGDDAR